MFFYSVDHEKLSENRLRQSLKQLTYKKKILWNAQVVKNLHTICSKSYVGTVPILKNSVYEFIHEMKNVLIIV